MTESQPTMFPAPTFDPTDVRHVGAWTRTLPVAHAYCDAPDESEPARAPELIAWLATQPIPRPIDEYDDGDVLLFFSEGRWNQTFYGTRKRGKWVVFVDGDELPVRGAPVAFCEVPDMVAAAFMMR